MLQDIKDGQSEIIAGQKAIVDGQKAIVAGIDRAAAGQDEGNRLLKAILVTLKAMSQAETGP